MLFLLPGTSVCHLLFSCFTPIHLLGIILECSRKCFLTVKSEITLLYTPLMQFVLVSYVRAETMSYLSPYSQSFFHCTSKCAAQCPAHSTTKICRMKHLPISCWAAQRTTWPDVPPLSPLLSLLRLIMLWGAPHLLFLTDSSISEI